MMRWTCSNIPQVQQEQGSLDRFLVHSCDQSWMRHTLLQQLCYCTLSELVHHIFTTLGAVPCIREPPWLQPHHLTYLGCAIVICTISFFCTTYIRLRNHACVYPADCAEARQWLKQLQGYVLQLSKQVADAAASDAQQCEASSTTSSMDEAMGSSNCSMAGTAACDTAWRVMCQDAADVLGRLGDQLSGGAASSVSDCKVISAATQRASIVVAVQALLHVHAYVTFLWRSCTND
jgi:hypothetical protein